MKERGIAISILVFSLVYFAGSISLSVGTVERPGPGFMPAAVAFALFLAAGFNVYKAFRGKPDPAECEDNTDENMPWFTPIGITVILFAYPLILRPANYIIATFIVLFALFMLMRFKNWYISLAVSLFIAFFSFYLFSNVLGVVLPSGTIEDIILRL